VVGSLCVAAAATVPPASRRIAPGRVFSASRARSRLPLHLPLPRPRAPPALCPRCDRRVANYGTARSHARQSYACPCCRRVEPRSRARAISPSSPLPPWLPDPRLQCGGQRPLQAKPSRAQLRRCITKLPDPTPRPIAPHRASILEKPARRPNISPLSPPGNTQAPEPFPRNQPHPLTRHSPSYTPRTSAGSLPPLVPRTSRRVRRGVPPPSVGRTRTASPKPLPVQPSSRLRPG